MLLICPACGARASAECWQNDAEVRKLLALLIELPNPIQTRVFPYLSLFRPGGRGLSWSRARRLLVELAESVKAGRIQIKGGEERPAPIAAWAEAMEITIESRPQALKNHNYLRKIVWEKAVGVAAKAEEDKDKKRREAWTNSRNEEPERVSKEEFEEGINRLFRPHPNPLPGGEGD